MASDYVPKRDADALLFFQTFAAGLVASPSTYQISLPEAQAIQSSVEAFAAALSDVSDPSQRTPVNIAIKDEARNAAEQLVRQYASLIKYNAGISNPEKIAIGVRPVNPNREPIFCPQSSPVLNVVAATPGAHTLRFADSLDPEKRGKPEGSSELQLFMIIDEEPGVDPEQAKFVGKFTKNPMTVGFVAADNTKQATYWGRWGGRRGDVGQWSAPVTMAIAA